VTTLDEVEARLAPLEAAAYEAVWQLSIDGSAEHQAASLATSLAYEQALGDPELHAVALADDDDPRRAVLRLMTTPKQRPAALTEQTVTLETDLYARITTFRAHLRGTEVGDNEIDAILLSSSDVALRREAWEASRAVGAAVGDDLLTLVALRNGAAQALGFRDHYAMSLAMQEFEEGWLFALLDDLDASLDAAWTAERAAIDADVRGRLALADDEPLRPWHLADRFFQDAPAPAVDPLAEQIGSVDILDACRRYFAELGHDVEPILARSDLYPRKGKDQHAFQITVGRGDDIRTLCNIEPSQRWLETTLHELGHAIYDQSLDPALPWLLRTPSHIFTTEAIAMYHGRHGRDASFLTRYAGLPAEVAHDPRNAALTRRNLHVFVAWVQVMARFERALYADPTADLNAVWWGLVERYQRLARPPGERRHEWATKMHLVVAPVYYHNYLLGEICASQLAATTANAEIRSRFLAPGRSLRWDALIEHATGAPLDVAAFVADLS
jgi:peptidyl-dipeptidase A